MTHADQLRFAAGHALINLISSHKGDASIENQTHFLLRALDAIAQYTIQLAAERQADNTIRKPND